MTDDKGKGKGKGKCDFDQGAIARPLISLIVPVWGDDDLAVKLVNDLPTSADVCE